MSDANPFQVIFVITVIMLMASATFAVVAPSLNIKVPKAPTFPIIPDLNAQGNQTALLGGGWAFNETHQVSAWQDVPFTSFHTHKHVITQSGFDGDVFLFEREGSFIYIPMSFREPISRLDGTSISSGPSAALKVQMIVSSFNGSYSTFIIDDGNNAYMAYVSFSPLPGYGNMVDSWNSGHGFTVMMYGDAYQPLSWTDQVGIYLDWFASVIGYFVYFAAYIIAMAGLFLTFMTAGFIPNAVGSGIIILVSVVFVGSLLMYLRGNSGGGK
jgi:hypothetical protein